MTIWLIMIITTTTTTITVVFLKKRILLLDGIANILLGRCLTGEPWHTLCKYESTVDFSGQIFGGMFFIDLSNSFIHNCNVKCKRCGSVKNWNTTWSVFWTNLHCFVFLSSVFSKNWHFIILMSNSATCLLLLVAEQMYRNDQYPYLTGILTVCANVMHLI